MTSNNPQNIKLGKIIAIEKGKKISNIFEDYSDGLKRAIQIDDLRNNNNVKYTNDDSGIEVNKSDIIIAWDGANAGTVGFGLKGIIGSTLAKLSLNSNLVLPNFLGKYLQTKFDFIRSQCTGATIPHVSKNVLINIEIPVFSTTKQKRIVEILDKADTLRQKRKQALTLLVEFLRSTFLEMFGDVVKNPNQWEEKTLKQISEKFSDGPFGSNLKTEHYTKTGVRVIRLQNVGIAKFIDDDKAYISEKYYQNLEKYSCYPGDVIIGTMGNPNIRACTVPESINVAINKADCIQLRPDKKKACSQYICYLLNLPQTMYIVFNLIHGQTRSRISMGQLSAVKLPIPPIDLQNQFAKIVEQTEAIRAKMQQSLQEMENQFQALMQRAFRGEL